MRLLESAAVRFVVRFRRHIFAGIPKRRCSSSKSFTQRIVEKLPAITHKAW